MSNPVLVNVFRDNVVESFHTGAIAVCDSVGNLRIGIGEVGKAVFPRSAIKALQAIPVIESGAADKFELTDRELAVVCSSHNGEALHVETVKGLLAKMGLEERNLECGTQWPRHLSDSKILHLKDEVPSQLHNNCSGKHAGLLATSLVSGFDTKGYTSVKHPVQKLVRDVLSEMTGQSHGEKEFGIDGCSIPSYPVEIQKLATAFARYATGEGISSSRFDACRKLYRACAAEPFMVAGTDRFCTDVMQVFEGKVFTKTGAEGVFCGAIPELGLGVALKCDDGSTRASEAMMATVIESLVEANDAHCEVLKRFNQRPILNRNENTVGFVKPSEEFISLLQRADAL